MIFPPKGDEFNVQHLQEVHQGELTNMKAQLGKQTGIGLALLATLLATLFAMGVFSVAQADTHSAMRSFDPDPVVPGGEITVTITLADYTGGGVVEDTYPSDYTLVSAGSGRDAGNDKWTYFLLEDEVPSVSYTLRAPMTPGESPAFMGTFASQGDSVPIAGDPSVTVGTGATDGGNGEADAPNPLQLSSKVAGAAVQVVAGADADAEVSSATDIVVDLKKFGVPSAIGERSVIITGTDGVPQAYVGEPSSVTVSGTKVTLALYSRFPGQSTATGAGTLKGPYKVTFKQSAGITNPIVAGTATVTVKDADAGVETIKEKIQSKVSLSGAAGARGTGVTVSVVGIGKGGATVYLVKGCPDQQTDDKGVKNCDQENDISLGNAESSGGKISVDVETSSSDFIAGVTQVDKDGTFTRPIHYHRRPAWPEPDRHR